MTIIIILLVLCFLAAWAGCAGEFFKIIGALFLGWLVGLAIVVGFGYWIVSCVFY